MWQLCVLQDEDKVLTVFPVEADLPLVLLLTLQSFVHLLDDALAGLVPVEEAAGARPLHHLGPHKAGQLTEAVRTVDDGVAVTALSVSQKEITVCMRGRRRCCCHLPETLHTSAAIKEDSQSVCFNNKNLLWFWNKDLHLIHYSSKDNEHKAIFVIDSYYNEEYPFECGVGGPIHL